MRKLINMVYLALFLAALSCDNRLDLTTVSSLDIDRYMGRWYEIARIDNRYERGMVGVTANYTLLENGTIAVLNSGYHNSLDGEYTSSEGVAKQRRGDNAGALKVAFFLKFYTPYNILELDQAGYSYALVSGGNDGYLWILSRTPQLEDSIIDSLVASAKRRGFDTSRLILVEQPSNEV